MIPPCCIPSPDASTAEILYCAYNAGGPPERAGLTWDDKPVPTWAELDTPRGAPVRAKWEAVAGAAVAAVNVARESGYQLGLLEKRVPHAPTSVPAGIPEGGSWGGGAPNESTVRTPPLPDPES